MEIAQYSAAQLFVCFQGEGSRAHDGETAAADAPAAAAAGCAAAGGAAAAGVTDAAGGAADAADAVGAAEGEGVASALFDTDALQVWVLKGCQQQLKGGLRDKPGKPPDYYHTCYCLSGLSVAQHTEGGAGVLGAPENELRRTDLLLNLLEERVDAARAYFAAQPPV